MTYLSSIINQLTDTSFELDSIESKLNLNRRITCFNRWIWISIDFLREIMYFMID